MAPPREGLRSGFTTGACAAAAARGALLALLHQKAFADATIRLPHGPEITFALHSCSFTATEGRASVIKDAGDDPDVTDKAEIRARVAWSEGPGVSIQRGEGVGLVTKSGLPVPPGEPAINPVPRSMIRGEIEGVLNAAHAPRPGVTVEISVPQGAEMARKTFNPRLGIVGGISILGTSGIVVPYSNAAWVASVLQAIDVAAAQGCRHLVLTVGGRSEKAAQQIFALPEVAFVQIGPFFGEALAQCKKVAAARVSLVAMIGKLAKFAAGSASVHSTVSSQDFDFLARLASAVGADAALIERVRNANTAQEVAELLSARHPEFFTLLCQEGWRFGASMVGKETMLEVLLTGIHGELLARYPPS